MGRGCAGRTGGAERDVGRAGERRPDRRARATGHPGRAGGDERRRRGPRPARRPRPTGRRHAPVPSGHRRVLALRPGVLCGVRRPRLQLPPGPHPRHRRQRRLVRRPRPPLATGRGRRHGVGVHPAVEQRPVGHLGVLGQRDHDLQQPPRRDPLPRDGGVGVRHVRALPRPAPSRRHPQRPAGARRLWPHRGPRRRSLPGPAGPRPAVAGRPRRRIRQHPGRLQPAPHARRVVAAARLPRRRQRCADPHDRRVLRRGVAWCVRGVPGAARRRRPPLRGRRSRRHPRGIGRRGRADRAVVPPPPTRRDQRYRRRADRAVVDGQRRPGRDAGR